MSINLRRMSNYRNCLLCPRACGINREEGQRGYCGETSELRLAFAGIHRGEEPPLTGKGGSGVIFVSGCNLGCVFCQNFQISTGGKKEPETIGRVVPVREFAEICLALQERGAENINIVTGSHAAPALERGINAARKQGLFIPVLWNSSGYEGTETLEILRDFVDVYLPDLKTLDKTFSAGFFNAPDYPEYAAAAILKMMEHRELCFGAGLKEGGRESAVVITSGVIIRHLVIPGFLEGTRLVLRWFAKNCADAGNNRRAILSLMTQYTPVQTGKKAGLEIPESVVSESDYEAVLSMLDEFGIEDGFCQELVTGMEWLPDFRRRNPFSSELSIPVWHWQDE